MKKCQYYKAGGGGKEAEFDIYKAENLGPSLTMFKPCIKILFVL